MSEYESQVKSLRHNCQVNTIDKYRSVYTSQFNSDVFRFIYQGTERDLWSIVTEDVLWTLKQELRHE